MTTQPSSTPSTELPRRKRHSAADRFRQNVTQKLIAFALALVLFFVVQSDRSMTMTFDEIPVTVRIPDGYAQLGGNSNPKVNVKVYGRASKLRKVTRDDLGTVSIMPSAREGNVQVTLHAEMLSMPDGVKVEKFQPEFISITLEPIARRSVPITTDHAFTGKLAPGYQLGEIHINPAEIEISGARSLVDETTQLYIEPIDLTGKAAPFTVRRWAIINRTGIQAVASPRVEVSVNVVSKAKQHVVLGVPIVSLNLTRKHEFVPATVDLTLVGDEEALAKIDTSRLFVTIDAAADDSQPAHARLIDQKEIQVPNLPAGVGFDGTRLPSVLLKTADEQGRKPAPAAPAPTPAE